MLQKSLHIQIKTAPSKIPLLPVRNLRIEYLERSDKLGAPPYITPIAFLSLPDIVYVNQPEDVMVVLRNNTPVSMNYVWGEPIGLLLYNILYDEYQKRSLVCPFIKSYTTKIN